MYKNDHVCTVSLYMGCVSEKRGEEEKDEESVRKETKEYINTCSCTKDVTISCVTGNTYVSVWFFVYCDY